MNEMVINTRPRYANEMRRDRRRDRRRVPNELRRTWQVGDIWEVHHQIKRMIFMGLNNEEIAKKVGRTPVMVSMVRNSKVIKDQLAVMQAAADCKAVNLRKEIEEFAPKCLEILKDVISGTNRDASIGLRVKTSQDWLDRAGHGKIQKTENLHGHFTAEELADLKRSAKQRAKSNGQVVDAEYEEVS